MSRFIGCRPAAVGGVLSLLVIAAVATSSMAAFIAPGTARSQFSSTSPVEVEIIGIDAGDNFTLGWSTAGVLYAWGANDRGQLGIGQIGGNSPVPVRVTLPHGTPPLVQADAGVDFGIALTADGGVLTWGADPRIHATLGSPARMPFFDELPSRVVGVSAGAFFYLAWTDSGELYSWGNNGGGRLGRDTIDGEYDPTPRRVTSQGLDQAHVAGASAGRWGAIAYTGDDRVAVWGTAQFDGAAGVQLTGLEDRAISGVASGSREALVWTEDGALFDVTAPQAQQVEALTQVSQAAITSPREGASSYYALSGGRLYAWGDNTYGQLGLGQVGSAISDPTSVDLPEVTLPLRSIAAGASHTVLLDGAGHALGSGSDDSGELGFGSYESRSIFTEARRLYKWAS